MLAILYSVDGPCVRSQSPQNGSLDYLGLEADGEKGKMTQHSSETCETGLCASKSHALISRQMRHLTLVCLYLWCI